MIQLWHRHWRFCHFNSRRSSINKSLFHTTNLIVLLLQIFLISIFHKENCCIESLVVQFPCPLDSKLRHQKNNGLNSIPNYHHQQYPNHRHHRHRHHYSQDKIMKRNVINKVHPYVNHFRGGDGGGHDTTSTSISNNKFHSNTKSTSKSNTALHSIQNSNMDIENQTNQHSKNNNNTYSPKSSKFSKSSSKTNKIKNTKNTRIKTKLSIATLLLATSLNLLGFTMTSPLNPSLGKHYALPVGASFGSLTSAYPLGMLGGIIVWPRLSDVIGRKPVICISLLGSGLGLALQCLVVKLNLSLSLFLIMRVFTGSFAGAAPAIKSYLADICSSTSSTTSSSSTTTTTTTTTTGGTTTPTNGTTNGVNGTEEEEEEKEITWPLPVLLGWRDAASTLAYIIGPALGGVLYQARRNGFSSSSSTNAATTAAATATNMGSEAIAFVIGISAAASLLAAALVGLLLEDRPRNNVSLPISSNQTSLQKDKKNNEANLIKIEHDPEIIACPLGIDLWSGVASVCVVSFLYNIADSTFFAFFPALLQNTFHLDAGNIGTAFTAFASISFCVSASSISSTLIQRLGVVKTCALGLSIVGSGLMALSFASGVTTTGAAAAAAAAMGTVGSSGGIKSILVFIAAALYFCGVPIYSPTIPTMLLRCVPSHQRGTVLGIDGAVNTVARVIAPLFMGEVYRRSGSRVAFFIAACSAFSSASIALFRRFSVFSYQSRSSSSSSSSSSLSSSLQKKGGRKD